MPFLPPSPSFLPARWRARWQKAPPPLEGGTFSAVSNIFLSALSLLLCTTSSGIFSFLTRHCLEPSRQNDDGFFAVAYFRAGLLLRCHPTPSKQIARATTNHTLRSNHIQKQSWRPPPSHDLCHVCTTPIGRARTRRWVPLLTILPTNLGRRRSPPWPRPRSASHASQSRGGSHRG